MLGAVLFILFLLYFIMPQPFDYCLSMLAKFYLKLFR